MKTRQRGRQGRVGTLDLLGFVLAMVLALMLVPGRSFGDIPPPSCDLGTNNVVATNATIRVNTVAGLTNNYYSGDTVSAYVSYTNTPGVVVTTITNLDCMLSVTNHACSDSLLLTNCTWTAGVSSWSTNGQGTNAIFTPVSVGSGTVTFHVVWTNTCNGTVGSTNISGNFSFTSPPGPGLQLRMPLANSTAADPSTTSAASDTSNGGINITMNMFSNGTAAFNLHGVGMTDLTTNICPTQGINQPVSNPSGNNTTAAAIIDLLNSTTLTNLGSNGNITNFTATMWFNEQFVCNQGLIGPRMWVLNAGASGTDINGSANSMGIKFQASNQLYFDMGTADGLLSGMLPGSVDFPAHQWIFIAVTYDGTTFNMYYGTTNNGVTLIGSTTAANHSISLGSAACLAIGNRATDFYRGFNGSVQDFRIYNGGASQAFVESVRESTTQTRLDYWPFDNTNTWVGAGGQLPLQATNVSGVPSWNTNAVLIDSTNLAILKYRDVETNGDANINLQSGTVRFWFSPDWSSTNAGGVGPQNEGRMIELGTKGSTNGWWGLAVGSGGTNLYFGTQGSATNTLVTNLTSTISWTSNIWHQIVLTYSVSNTSLYIDGQSVVTNGIGITNYPGAIIRGQGFTVGGSVSGTNQARGIFDELDTFNYALTAAQSQSDYSQAIVAGAGGNSHFFIKLTSPLNGAHYAELATIPIQASVVDWNGAITNVVFFRSSIQVNVVTNIPYQYSWPIVAAGSYTLTAVARDVSGLSVTSAPVSISVTNLCSP